MPFLNVGDHFATKKDRPVPHTEKKEARCFVSIAPLGRIASARIRTLYEASTTHPLSHPLAFPLRRVHVCFVLAIHPRRINSWCVSFQSRPFRIVIASIFPSHRDRFQSQSNPVFFPNRTRMCLLSTLVPTGPTHLILFPRPERSISLQRYRSDDRALVERRGRRGRHGHSSAIGDTCAHALGKRTWLDSRAHRRFVRHLACVLE